MKTQTKLLNLVVMLMMGFSATTSWGQSQADSLAMDDDQIMATIAKYPADMRKAILDVAQYPKVLIKLEKVQSRSSQSFQDLVEPLSRTEQEMLYQASRFPETVSQMVMVGKDHPSRVQPIIKDFPDQLQQQLFDAYNKHYDELVKMDGIYQTAQGKLATLTDDFPESTQNSFKKVLANPDVMTLLTDNINLTVSLGNSYQTDPQGISNQLDELNQKLTEQGGKDLLAYQETVAKDPALQNEMKSAADDYSQQNNQPYGDPNYVNNYYYNTPYPYWFGYPSWYGSPMWYPYSYYQSGYYFGAGGRIIITGMPSYYYSRWFYGRGYSRYPRMYNCYNSYYYRPMRNIAYGYRDMYTRGNYSYNNRNYRGGSSYYSGNRSRSYSPSAGYSGRSSYSGSDSYRRTRYSGSSTQPNLQQGSSYRQSYTPYHASTYYNNPSIRSTNSGSRGFSTGGGYRGGSRGSSGTGFSGGFSGGSRGFGGGGRGAGGGGGHSSGGGGHGRGR